MVTPCPHTMVHNGACVCACVTVSVCVPMLPVAAYDIIVRVVWGVLCYFLKGLCGHACMHVCAYVCGLPTATSQHVACLPGRKYVA